MLSRTQRLLLLAAVLGGAFAASVRDTEIETGELTCSASLQPSALKIQDPFVSGHRYTAGAKSFKAISHVPAPALAAPAFSILALRSHSLHRTTRSVRASFPVQNRYSARAPPQA